jgi:hypothetical protein
MRDKLEQIAFVMAATAGGVMYASNAYADIFWWIWF